MYPVKLFSYFIVISRFRNDIPMNIRKFINVVGNKSCKLLYRLLSIIVIWIAGKSD